MFADFVKKVTFSCPQCTTSITFDILSSNTRELFNATDRLACPKCSESLSYDACRMLRAIDTYNNAVQALNDTEKTLVQNFSKLSAISVRIALATVISLNTFARAITFNALLPFIFLHISSIALSSPSNAPLLI